MALKVCDRFGGCGAVLALFSSSRPSNLIFGVAPISGLSTLAGSSLKLSKPDIEVDTDANDDDGRLVGSDD